MQYTTVDAISDDFDTFRQSAVIAIRDRDTEAIRRTSADLRAAVEARCVSSADRTAAVRCIGLAVDLYCRGIVAGESGAESPLYLGAALVEVAKAEAQAKWCANPDWSAAHVKPARFG